MIEALARSIAETTADTLGARAATVGARVSDEAIGLHLWHVRGFRDHDDLVSLINHTREILDRREAEEAVSQKFELSRRRDNSETNRRRLDISPVHRVEAPSPVQLAFDLVTA